MDEEGWRPTCGKVYNSIWIDCFGGFNDTANYILIAPNEWAMISNKEHKEWHETNAVVIPLTKELLFALRLARPRDRIGSDIIEDKITGKFILEYIKKKKE